MQQLAANRPDYSGTASRCIIPAIPKQKGLRKLTQRTSGSHYSFWLDGRRITTQHSNLKAVEVWRLEYMTGEAMGVQSVKQEGCTLNDIFDLVERDHQDKPTVDSTLSRLKRLRRFFGKMRVVELRENHISAYRAGRVRGLRFGRPVEPASVNRELELLRRGLNLGKRATPPLVLHAPFVKMVREENIRTQRITHDQYLALVDVLPTPAKEAAVIAYHIGWRSGAIFGLDWDRVDWADKVIRPPSSQEKSKRVGTAPIYGGMQDALRGYPPQGRRARHDHRQGLE